MYKRLEKLDPARFGVLRRLHASIPLQEARGHRVRMGVNGIERLSKYNYSRWMKWKADQRNEFKTVFPKEIIDNAVVGHFVHYPRGTGFLDRIETWKNDKSPCCIYGFVVHGEGKIILNDEEVIVPEGEGICFSLRDAHEIPATLQGQVWAFVMIFDDLLGVR